MTILKKVALWWRYSGKLQRTAVAIAGRDYYTNRHVIKRQIRQRVRAVLSGFDPRVQTVLFCEDVSRIIGEQG